MKKGRCWLVHNGFSKTESTRLSLERLRQNLLSKNVDVQIKKHNLLPLYFDESGNAVSVSYTHLTLPTTPYV